MILNNEKSIIKLFVEKCRKKAHENWHKPRKINKKPLTNL